MWRTQICRRLKTHLRTLGSLLWIIYTKQMLHLRKTGNSLLFPTWLWGGRETTFYSTVNKDFFFLFTQLLCFLFSVGRCSQLQNIAPLRTNIYFFHKENNNSKATKNITEEQTRNSVPKCSWKATYYLSRNYRKIDKKH